MSNHKKLAELLDNYYKDDYDWETLYITYGGKTICKAIRELDTESAHIREDQFYRWLMRSYLPQNVLDEVVELIDSDDTRWYA